MRLLIIALLAIVALTQVDASCCGCGCGCCGCCCPCPCCCSKPIVIKLPPPPTKIVPCCCCCKPCCCCCRPCCCCGGRRKRALSAASARGALGNASLVPRVSEPQRKSRCACCEESAKGCGSKAANPLPVKFPIVSGGHPTPSCALSCPPCSQQLVTKRQKRSVVAVLRERLAEKKFIIKSKSAFRDNMLFDLF